MYGYSRMSTTSNIIMEDELIQYLNTVEDYNLEDLANSWNLGISRMCTKIQKYKINFRKHGRQIGISIDSNSFDKLYYYEDFSGDKIADLIKCDKKTIYQWMKLFGRPTKQEIKDNFPFPNEKECFICGRLLPLEDFSKLGVSYDNHMSRCKECDHKIGKDYYDRNLDKVIAYREQYLSNPKNKAKKRFTAYRRRSIKRFGETSFDLSFDEFLYLILQPCEYCDGFDIPVNGLDRVDNTRGYNKDNVVSCCKRCNYMKSDMTPNQFRKLVGNIYDRFNSNGS